MTRGLPVGFLDLQDPSEQDSPGYWLCAPSQVILFLFVNSFSVQVKIVPNCRVVGGKLRVFGCHLLFSDHSVAVEMNFFPFSNNCWCGPALAARVSFWIFFITMPVFSFFF